MCALLPILQPLQQLRAELSNLFQPQLVAVIPIDQPFMDREVATDYILNVMLEEQVKADIFCQVPLVRSRFSHLISCWKNSVILEPNLGLMSKVEQDGCESAGQERNRAGCAYWMDLRDVMCTT